MASFIVDVMVRGIHELIQGIFVFWSKTSKIKHLENRALYGNSNWFSVFHWKCNTSLKYYL